MDEITLIFSACSFRNTLELKVMYLGTGATGIQVDSWRPGGSWRTGQYAGRRGSTQADGAVRGPPGQYAAGRMEFADRHTAATGGRAAVVAPFIAFTTALWYRGKQYYLQKSYLVLLSRS